MTALLQIRSNDQKNLPAASKLNRGSSDNVFEGNTNYHTHSRLAFGYFRAKAYGKETRPYPFYKP